MKAKRFSIITLGTALTASAVAAGATVPFDVQVPLVLKALTYDRTLKARAGDQVRIAVLIPGKAGRLAAEEMASSVAALPDRTINGMPVSFREIIANDERAIEQALTETRWTAVYVLPGFGRDELAAIRRTCESRHILAVAAAADDVERSLAFGVGSQGGKPQLVVNLANTKACGSDFDLALLRLARVIQ